MLHHSLILRDLVLAEHPASWPLPFHLDLGLSERLLIEGIGLGEAEQLARTAATLLPPKAGEVVLWGRVAADLNRTEVLARRRAIALITPDQVLLHRITVGQNLSLAPSYHQGVAPADFFRKQAPLLQRLELDDRLDAFPLELPPVLAHRALWARELFKEPDLLVAVIGGPVKILEQQQVILPLLRDWLAAHPRTAVLLLGRTLRNFHPLAHRVLRFHNGRFLEHHFLEHESRPLESFLPWF